MVLYGTLLKKTKHTLESITEFVMVVLVILGIVSIIMETVMVPVGLYW